MVSALQRQLPKNKFPWGRRADTGAEMGAGLYKFVAELGSNIPMKLVFEGMIEGSGRTSEAR